MPLRKTSSLRVLIVVSLLGFLPTRVSARDGDIKEKILAGFYPYRQDPPRAEGITPGTKINKDNFQVAEKVFFPEILRVVQATVAQPALESWDSLTNPIVLYSEWRRLWSA